MIGLLLFLAQVEPSREGIEFFEKKIRPILVERCYDCHSAKAQKAKAGLLVDSREGLLRGGDSGPALVPGKPEESLLLKAIRYEGMEMPPKEKGRLPPEQLADFETWIVLGAPDPRKGDAAAPARSAIDFSKAREFWSFRPVRDPALPAVRDAAWPAGAVDRFVLSRLEARGLRPGPDADRRALLRRVTFDLVGLPPSPEEIDAFLRDDAPDAFAKVVDRLLASPRYGERWGRHWLDVARYADTSGCNSDFPVRQARLYRDWVLRAFNEDKPYADFLREQVAGDLLPAATEEERRAKVVATGYLAISRRFVDSIEKYHHLTLDDTVDTLGKSVLGLSLGCARCHDHKYDPVAAEDYFALYGIFASTRYPYPGCETYLRQKDLVPLVPREEAEAAMKPYLEKLAALDQAAKAAGKDAQAKAKKERDAWERDGRPEIESAYAVAEGTPQHARIQIKGDPRKLGAEVPRRFLQVLGGRPVADPAKGSGRLDLAGWLADLANPLAPRVLVNRIWQHHFGRGIVRTPNDFGARGLPPTHPELLDWLAARFLEGGGSIKALHRTILLSRTYRLAAADLPDHARADPSNELYGRFERRRLDAEAIRDAMLSASGAIDLEPSGAHPFPPQKQWGFSASRPFQAAYPTRKRSVYLVVGRIRNHPFLETFDGADPNLSTAERLPAASPLQALFLMNNAFVTEQSEKLAARVRSDRADLEGRVERAHALAFGRLPTSEERRRAEAFLGRAAAAAGAEGPAWASYARVLLSSNEFIFTD